MIWIIITAAIVGIFIGGLIIWYLHGHRHNHEWTLIDSGNLYKKDRYGETIRIGMVKVYECKVCKQIKKNSINY